MIGQSPCYYIGHQKREMEMGRAYQMDTAKQEKEGQIKNNVEKIQLLRDLRQRLDMGTKTALVPRQAEMEVSHNPKAK